MNETSPNDPKGGTRTPLLVSWLGPTAGAVAMFVVEIAKIVIIAVAIIVVVRYFLIQPFVVKGASMEPSFYDKEYLIVDEVTYRFRDPVRGEVVVFHPPERSAEGFYEESSQYYIKRVIGLPGETVEIRDGRITIYNEDEPNGVLLDETYTSEYTDGHMRVVVPAGQYFLMGDNRDASLDSRTFGSVPFENLIGRVWVRGYPLDRLGGFSVPEYNF
ncbi:signal peptidase I [Candidatus Uhrbacteria bacterium]|nr:signal peptidase I [Candidatus Uhrbacteria bacterium]